MTDSKQIIIEYKEAILKFRYAPDSDDYLGIYIWSANGFTKLRGWKSDGSLEVLKRLRHFFNSIELPGENNEE